jgi:hypothetical protein
VRGEGDEFENSVCDGIADISNHYCGRYFGWGSGADFNAFSKSIEVV